MQGLSSWARGTTVVGAMALTLAGLVSEARADVEYEGAWPKSSPKVSLNLSKATRTEALQALGAQAKWNFVLRDKADDGAPFTMSLKDADAFDVLEALLADGSWVADWQGSLITIRKAEARSERPEPPPLPDRPERRAALPPEPPPPPPRDETARSEVSDDQGDAPRAKREGRRDLTILANSLRIGKDEVVRNVSVFGGSVDIEGRVTGNLTLYGGSAHLYETGKIDGNVSITGGSMDLDPGATIGGDLDVVGGHIEGTEDAKIGGNVTLDPSDGTARASMVSRVGHEISSGLRSAAFFFVLGVIFIALGGTRAEEVRVSIADKPMKSIALGIVGLIGTIIALILCCLTIVGIPIAAIAFIAAVALGLAGITAGLTVLGAMVANHKTKNVYLHLAVGCAIFMVVGFVPFIGGLAQAAVVFAGFGGIVSTRALGLLRRKPKQNAQAGAYRTA